MEPDIRYSAGPLNDPTKIQYAEPDPNVIVTPAGVISTVSQDEQSENRNFSKATPEYSIIPNNIVAKSNNSSLYAEPDPNVIVTPVGVVEQQSDTPSSAEQTDNQAYAEPYQPCASPIVKNSTNAYEDIDSPATNQGKEYTYEVHLPADDTLVKKSSNEEVDKDNRQEMYSKPKKQVPSTDYATPPHPAYTKVDKVSSSKSKQPGSEHDMVSGYGHLQATQTSNDGSYQKLDRGVDVRMKDGR